MNMPKVAPPAPPEKRKGAIATLRDLWPYMWPKDRADLKRRVLVALSVLIGAKIITVLVPYTYKWATDALTGSRRGLPPDAHPDLGLAVILTVPIMLVVANGVGIDQCELALVLPKRRWGSLDDVDHQRIG